MAERNLSIRLSVVDGGKVKAELSEIGEKGERSLKKIEAAATPASGGLKLLSSAANDAKFQLQAATDRLGVLGSVLGKLGPAGSAMSSSSSRKRPVSRLKRSPRSTMRPSSRTSAPKD